MHASYLISSHQLPFFLFPFSGACEASGTVSTTPLQHEWTQSVENIPEDVSNRWSFYMIKDMNTNIVSSLQSSDFYRSWDGQSSANQSVGKLLQDAVRGACMKCGFEEKKATALLSFTNVLEPGPGRALQLAYSKQILKDVKRICRIDPNLSETMFPSLFISINE